MNILNNGHNVTAPVLWITQTISNKQRNEEVAGRDGTDNPLLQINPKITSPSKEAGGEIPTIGSQHLPNTVGIIRTLGYNFDTKKFGKFLFKKNTDSHFVQKDPQVTRVLVPEHPLGSQEGTCL